MSAVTTDTVSNIFKRVYGKLENAVPAQFVLDKELPFSSTSKVGERFVIGVVLSMETGITLAGTAQSAFTINSAIAGSVKQASIIPSQTLLSSVIPFAYISRSQGNEQAFIDGTKFVVSNHMKSHARFLETFRLYGQADALLGYVSYAPSGTVYRGATYTGAGDVTLTKSDGSTIAFTDGVNTTDKAILLAPGQFAAGIWVGMEGVRVNQVDTNEAIVASGTLTGVDADLGILYVDFTPVVATSTTSHRVCFDGMQSALEAVGLNKILTNTGSLFDISAATYSLWRSSVLDLGNKRFNLKALEMGVAQAVNRGGLDKPLLIMVNPRTFANMTQDEAALRKYDSSYSSSAKNGFEEISYFAANGLNRIVSHPMVKEGEVYGLCLDDWVRSGSAEISFKVPGFGEQIIFPLENQAGYMFRSFSDQFLICQRPARQILWKNCNDEAVSY